MPKTREIARNTNGLGLLAISSRRRWQISVDECHDKDNEWIAEIEGPRTYVTFQLKSLVVLTEAKDFLQSHLPNARASQHKKTQTRHDTLSIGRFGNATVELSWDDEGPRCIFFIGHKAHSAFRLEFDKSEIKLLIKALGEVLQDLAPSPSKRPVLVGK